MLGNMLQGKEKGTVGVKDWRLEVWICLKWDYSAATNRILIESIVIPLYECCL